MSEKKVELKEEQSDVGSGGSEENKLPKWKKGQYIFFHWREQGGREASGGILEISGFDPVVYEVGTNYRPSPVYVDESDVVGP